MTMTDPWKLRIELDKNASVVELGKNAVAMKYRLISIPRKPKTPSLLTEQA